MTAVFHLGKLGPAAVPALIDTLKDDHSTLRKTAADMLGKVGPFAKDAIPALTTALRDRERVVREAAQEALDKIQAEK